jgi:hypothetical protein
MNLHLSEYCKGFTIYLLQQYLKYVKNAHVSEPNETLQGWDAKC